MSEQPISQPSKEIDLLDVMGRIFSGIGNGIKNFSAWIKRGIQTFFRLFLKYWWLFCALLIIGSAFGYYKHKLQRPYYETEMLVEANRVNSRLQIANRINSLQDLVNNANNQILANQLGLSVNEIRSIFYVKADIIDVKVEGKATRTVIRRDKDGVETEEIVEERGPQYIRVQVRVWENQNISKIERAIIKFIENDPYIVEQIKLAKDINQSQQKAVETEIEQLRLFQKKNIEKGSLVVSKDSPLMVQNEEKTYVDEILELGSRLAYLQREYELLRPLLVVQPFEPLEKPVDNRLRNILFFALLFFGIGYGAMLLREGWNRI